MFSAKTKEKIETHIDNRFDDLFGAEFRATHAGAKCLEDFRKWMRGNRCVLASTLPKRRGLVALKVSIRRAVKVKPS